MDLVTIALIIVALWIGVIVVVLAMCKASAHADADEERYLANRSRDVPNQSQAPESAATVGDERRSSIRAELEREAERLRVELPARQRPRLTRLVGTRRHHS
jgi:hypothetical protein